jgi:hypothetical protein
MIIGQNQCMKMEGDNESLDDSDEDMSNPSDVEVIKEVSYEGNKLVDSIGMYPTALAYS